MLSSGFTYLLSLTSRLFFGLLSTCCLSLLAVSPRTDRSDQILQHFPMIVTSRFSRTSDNTGADRRVFAIQKQEGERERGREREKEHFSGLCLPKGCATRS
jgi:hypothetical protein